MKLFIVLFALAAFAMAEAGPDLEARAGCSQKGKYCNGGTFLCCPGQGSCKGGVMAKRKYNANEPPSTEGVQRSPWLRDTTYRSAKAVSLVKSMGL